MTAGSGQRPEFVLVDGWRVTLGPHGVVVTKSPPLPAPTPQSAVRVLPEPSMDLVGRHAELSAVLQALRAGSPVNVWGECGIGKTTLLRVVANRTAAEFGDRPVVFLTAARQPLEDLLHEIHGCLYQLPTHTKRRADGIRDELRRAQAVLVLDDVALADADLADLLWTLRGSLVVVASPVRRQDPALRPIELDGLDENAAEELFRRGLASRRLEAGEDAEVRRLVGPGILRGHPLRVQQAAALVESGRRGPGELVQILQFGDPAARLAQECQSALTPQQRQIVGVLALAAGAFLPTDLVTQMCAVGQIITQLRSLRKSGVIDQRIDQFGLPVCSIGEPRKLVGPSVNTGLALRGLITWLQSPDTSAEGLLSVSGSILTVLEFAGTAGEWDSVLRIVRAIEPALITSGRWGQWHSALQSGLHAAEELHEDLERAYHLHQLGTRALCLGDHVQAAQLLNEAKSLRSGHGAHDAARVTAHNLALITPHRWWQRPATIAAAAAAILVVGAIVAAAVLAGTSSSPFQSPSPIVPPPSATSSGSVPPSATSSGSVPPSATSSGSVPPTTPPPTTVPPTTLPPTTPPPTTLPPTTPPPTTPPPTTPPPLR